MLVSALACTSDALDFSSLTLKRVVNVIVPNARCLLHDALVCTFMPHFARFWKCNTFRFVFVRLSCLAASTFGHLVTVLTIVPHVDQRNRL
jgi:hypothetical protein